MTRDQSMEPPQMAKVSKSFMLNVELSELTDAVSASTGASFTKIVTAALIQYLLGDLDHPHHTWMMAATALEKGDVAIPDLVVQFAQEKIRQLELEHGVSGEIQVEPGKPMTSSAFEYNAMRGAYLYWIEVVETARAKGHDPVWAVINECTTRGRQFGERYTFPLITQAQLDESKRKAPTPKEQE